MRKLITLIIVATISLAVRSGAELFPTAPEGVGFGPDVGRSPEDLRAYGRPCDMVSIVPSRPVAARDKNGNRVYFTPSGKLTMQVSQDGSMNFSLSGSARSTQVDSLGNVQVTESIKGTNRVEVRDGKGELIGYQLISPASKTLKQYDAEGNLVQSSDYNVYGKNVSVVTDMLNGNQVVYNSKGKSQYDLNYEGNKIATYQYDNFGRLQTRTDIAGAKTYYDGHNNPTQVVNAGGGATMAYNYKTIGDGSKVLVNTTDLTTGIVTTYTNGKPQHQFDEHGNVLTDYNYDGQNLAYSFDYITKQTTWYNAKTGRPVEVTYNDQVVEKYMYDQGKLLYTWDAVNYALTMYVRGAPVATIARDKEPNYKDVKAWIDAGVVVKQYSDGTNPALGLAN